MMICFFALPEDEIKVFCDRYKKDVQLPLIIFGLIPSLLTIEKLKLLIGAGLVEIRMGIQSGCKSTLKLYKRGVNLEKMIDAANMLHDYAKGVNVSYDFILDNPFESEEDVKKTLQFLGRLKKPFTLNLFPLTFYPGTGLYDMAKERGIISNEACLEEAVFQKNYFSVTRGYYNDLFKIANSLAVPKRIWVILVEKKRGYQFWYPLLMFVTRFKPELVSKGLRDILRGDFSRIIQFFLADPRRHRYS